MVTIEVPVVLIKPNSLSETVAAVCDAFFVGERIPATERKVAANWIAARQGMHGSYANTFAGFDAERQRGIQLFTGERITSASARHILGEEACRVLRQLDVRTRVVQQALDRADEGLLQCLARAAQDKRNTNPGLYCCGKCTVGLWRNLLVGGLDRQEERLRTGIKHLRTTRDGEGRWRVFPFWYTMLALSEAEGREAVAEIRYAAKKLERTVASKRQSASRFAHRHHAIARRALERA